VSFGFRVAGGVVLGLFFLHLSLFRDVMDVSGVGCRGMCGSFSPPSCFKHSVGWQPTPERAIGGTHSDAHNQWRFSDSHWHYQPTSLTTCPHFCCCCCLRVAVFCYLLLLLLLQPPSGPPPDAGGCRVGAITCWDLTLILSYIGLVGAVVAGVVVRRKRLQQQHLETALGLEGEGGRGEGREREEGKREGWVGGGKGEGGGESGEWREEGRRGLCWV